MSHDHAPLCLIRAARVGLLPYMRLIDDYLPGPGPGHHDMCEAGWIAYHRAQGVVLVNDAPGMCCGAPETCRCWERGAEREHLRAAAVARARAALQLRAAPSRAQVEREVGEARLRDYLAHRVAHPDFYRTEAFPAYFFADFWHVTPAQLRAHLVGTYTNYDQVLDEAYRTATGVGSSSVANLVAPLLDRAIDEHYAALLAAC